MISYNINAKSKKTHKKKQIKKHSLTDLLHTHTQRIIQSTSTGPRPRGLGTHVLTELRLKCQINF